MAKDGLLTVDQLSVTRQGRRLLEKVCFSLGAGERLALVGPNGAGKTTLLKCLNQIISDWSGAVTLEGRDIKSYRHRQRAQWLAYVPQQGVQNNPFTVEAFVTQARYPYQGFLTRSTPQDRDAVERALELTDIVALRERALLNLSGGERQRVLLAAALAQEARILLLDEPTAFLDPKHEAAFWQVLSRVHAERGVAMITVTHDLNQAVLRHDQVLALKQGRVVFAGDPEDFMNSSRLNEVYDNRFLLSPHPVTGQSMVLPEVAS